MTWLCEQKHLVNSDYTECPQCKIAEYELFDVGEVATIDDYPYGFHKRCVLKAWIEETKRGQRTVVQTIFAGRENAPKKSTYSTGRFFAKKDGRLFIGFIGKENVRIDTYRQREEVIKVPKVAVLNELPKRILEADNKEEKINTTLSKVWKGVEERHKARFDGKTHEDIKAEIRNIDNWYLGGGGWYMKDGFGKTYKGDVMVALSCGYISETITLKGTAGIRLTPKKKAEFKEQAKQVLNDFLPEMSISITDREGTYPSIRHVSIDGHTTTNI